MILMHYFIFQRPPSLEYKSDETVFGTFYDTATYVENPLKKNVNSYQAPRTSLNVVTLRFIIPVFTHAQPLFLTAIAVNRLTAICFPLKHAAMWSARKVAIVVFAMSMAAVLLGAGPSVVDVLWQAVVCWTATVKEREDRFCASGWVYGRVCLLFRHEGFKIILCLEVSLVCYTGRIREVATKSA